MPAPFSSPFASIGRALVARVSSSLGVPSAYVRPVANDRYKVTQAEPVFAYVQFFTPGKPRDPGLEYTDSGAGRLATPVGRRVRVYVYTRSGEDVYGGDEVALFGGDQAGDGNPAVSPGHFLVEEMVYNGLVNYMPPGSNGTPLCITPIHPLDASEQPERKPEDDAGLIRSCLDFEAVYLLSIDQADPPA